METDRVEPTTGYLVWRLSMRWRSQVDRVVAPFGLTHATYSVLASLHSLTRSGAAPRQRELAAVTGLDAPYVSKLIASLERDGLVRRVEHPEDTRAVQLGITPAGRRTIERAVTVVRQLHDEVLAPIGGPDGRQARQLRSTLQQLLGTTPSSFGSSSPPTRTTR